jgi:hypothetical protein
MVLAFLALVLHIGSSWPVASVMTITSAVATTSPPETTTAPRLRVLVRIDARGAGQGIRIPDVLDQVRGIWRPYIDIDFADGRTVNAPGYDDELTLVITDRPQVPGSADDVALGWTRFVAGRPESAITVSVAAARTLMSRGRWLGRPIDELQPTLQRQFVTHALGRSAAHEIGHYLLRSTAHAPDGLMRQRMTVPEIMDGSLSVFRLGTSAMCALERRAPTALASRAVNADEES